MCGGEFTNINKSASKENEIYHIKIIKKGKQVPISNIKIPPNEIIKVALLNKMGIIVNREGIR